MSDRLVINGITVVDKRRETDVPEDVVLAVLADAIRDGQGVIHYEKDLSGWISGPRWCVPTFPLHEDISLGLCWGRRGLSKHVLRRFPEKSSLVTVFATWDSAGYYVLLLSHFGPKCRPEPWDEEAFKRERDPQAARKESKDFWGRYAFVPGGCDLICAHPQCHKPIERGLARRCFHKDGPFCPDCRRPCAELLPHDSREPRRASRSRGGPRQRAREAHN